MVISQVLSPTVGWRSTSSTAAFSSLPVSARAGLRKPASLLPKLSPCGCTRVTSRRIFGGLPSSTSSGRSTGRLPNWLSFTTSCVSLVAVPTTANGQRSRSQIRVKAASLSGAMAST